MSVQCIPGVILYRMSPGGPACIPINKAACVPFSAVVTSAEGFKAEQQCSPPSPSLIVHFIQNGEAD